MIKIKNREKTRDRKLKREIKMEKREKVASFKKKIAHLVPRLDPWRLGIRLKKLKQVHQTMQLAHGHQLWAPGC